MVGKPNQNPSVAPLKPIPAVQEPFSEGVTVLFVSLRLRQGTKIYIQYCVYQLQVLPRGSTPNIVKALLEFFALVRLPHSIRSDQESNFTSGIIH